MGAAPPQPSPANTLSAACEAIEHRDFERADALYLEHLAHVRDDVAVLTDYGVFCMRTGRATAACYLLHKANVQRPDDIEIVNQLAYARLESGDHAIARSGFEFVLRDVPAHTQANYGLGLCLRQEGMWSAAVDAFAKALTATSDTFPILLSLADACAHAGDIAQARKYFKAALQLAPSHPAALLACAKFLREQSDPAQAMILIDRCAQQHPDEASLILEKARCLRMLGDPAHAVRWLHRLEKQSPGLAEIHEERGNCVAPDDVANREAQWLMAVASWIRAGNFASADTLLDRLLAMNPSSVAGWNARGTLEHARHRLDAAEAAWRSALAIDPSCLDSAASLALLCESANRIDEAARVAEDAHRFFRTGQSQAGASELFLVMGMIARRRKNYTGCIERLDIAASLATTDAQRVFVSFERGKTLDLSGDPAGAMRAFVRGNALAQDPWLRVNPGKNKALGGVEFMLDLVGKDWLRQWKPTGAPPETARLAFLVGFPRSGTTLLNQVLDSHPAIQAIEEKPTVQKIMDAVHAMPFGYPHALPDVDALDVDYLREAYFRAVAEHGAMDLSKLILDKFPMNITLAALLHRVFPKARFVFALRHPCDVVLSCFMQNFRLNPSMANFCTLADTVALYVKTMELWQVYREQLPLAVHTIRYEDVVDDFDGQVRALCDFLDVPWQDDLRDFSSKALERGRINTPSYEQVSRPIYREARYRWERYREFLEPFLPALRPWIERFGYGQTEL